MVAALAAIAAFIPLGLSLVTSHAAMAGDTPPVNQSSAPQPPAQEMWGGGEVSPRSWAAYTGVSMALGWPGAEIGPDVRADGWRLRVGGGYWGYNDRITRWDGTHWRPVPLRGNGSFAEALLGYHATMGPMTLKLFAGGAFRSEFWSPDGANLHLVGEALGPKLIVESWLNLTPRAFAQLDLSWTGIREEASARARLGYRLVPWLAVGPEAAYWHASEGEGGRLGAFARVEWAGGEASLSAGLLDEGGAGSRAYATASVLLRF